MRVLYCKFCEYTCQLMNGRRTLVGMFDDIRINQVPIDHPAFFLCVEMEFDPSEAGRKMDLLCLLMDEDGRELFRINAQGQVPPSTPHGFSRVQFPFPIPGLRIERPGIYRLDLIYNDAKIGEERLPVLVVAGPQESPPS